MTAVPSTLKPAPIPIQELTPPRLIAPAGACDCHMHIFEPRFPPRRNTPYPPPVATVADYTRGIRDRLGLSGGPPSRERE